MTGAFKQAIAYMKSIYSERLGRTRLENLTRLIAFIFHIVFIKGRLKAVKTVSDDLFFISFYFATTLSFKVFKTLFTVLILISTSSI